MDLVLTDAVQQLARLLTLDVETLLVCDTPEQLTAQVQKQLTLELPDTPWTLQYPHVKTPAFYRKVETDYRERQRQYVALKGQEDPTLLIRYVRNLLLIEILRLACLRQYDSIEQAQAVKVEVRDQVASVMLDSSDMMYMLWRDWKTLLIESIEQQEETLPHVVYVQRAESLPALVLSYQLYGTIEREQDLLNRNGIIHPTFCPVATPLETLSE